MNSSSIVRPSRWKAVAFGLSLVLIGLVIWDGADRRAADATKPLSQSPASATLRLIPSTLKVGSFNIHSGKGTDGARNLARTASLLTNVDFVGLYEVRGSADMNQAASLADLCEASWLFSPTERQWWTDNFGNGLLFRIPIHSAICIPLINTRRRAFRNAILSTVQIKGTDVRIIAVHVDRETDRKRQLKTIIDLFMSLQPPCVLMGDLNSPATDPIIIGLREKSDVVSPLHEFIPDGPPEQTIDWIFTRGLKTISAEFVLNSASDHPFLKAELAPLDSTAD